MLAKACFILQNNLGYDGVFGRYVYFAIAKSGDGITAALPVYNHRRDVVFVQKRFGQLGPVGQGRGKN